MAALLPLLASPCVTSVPHAYSYSPHSACVCAVRRRVHLLRGGKVLECDRRELIGDVLWLRMRGGQVRDPRVIFIICRDVHPVRRGQVLKCDRCVERVSAALPPFSPALLSMC